MSDKQKPATGEEQDEDKSQAEKTKRRRRRRKKPKPEQAEGAKAQGGDNEQPSPRPKKKRRPPQSKPRPSRPDEDRPEGSPRPPKRKKRKPRPKDGSPEAQEKEKPSAPPEDQILLQWSVHLFKRRRGISALVVALVIMATYFGYWLFHDWFLSVIVLLISMGALSAYFFPISYTLSERGMKMANFLAREDKEWKDFWTYVQYPDGVHLAYDQRKLKGRVRQGVMLYYDDEGALRERVIEIVSARLPAPEEVGLYKRKK